MGEEGDTVTELAEVSANSNAAAADTSEAFTEKNAEKDEIKEVEEESKEADEKDIENMDIDKEEVKESKADEEGKGDQESKGAEEKQETKFDVMEKKTAEIPDKDKEEVEDVANVQKEEKESREEHEVEKGSKESEKSESGAQKKDRKRKRKVEDKKELEPKTPLASTIVRPVRQRKSVERLVASIEGELTKEIYIEKGRGTALKDIPNVAYKLSKRKTDDTLKLLHTILFGRRGKAAQFKSNISQFSGFVWHENEEKQKMKVKEKLDKCVKEKLLELCDLLDIPVGKATSRKEDLESQLIDFLDAPHPTTSELLAEKDQSSKGKKHERASKKSPSSTIGSSEGSTKKHKKKKNVHEPKDDHKERPEVMKANDVQERSDAEMSNQAKTEEKDGGSEEESEKDKKKKKKKQSSSKSLSNEEPAGEVKTKKTPVSKRPSFPTKKTPSNSSKGSEKNDDNDANPKEYSKKKTTEVVKGKKSTPKKPSSKDNTTGKKVLNGKGHKKADKLKPSDDELRSAICEVLKEVDFNTATFTDIVKILAKRYDTDLTPRKTSVKNMIQDELTRLVDEADEGEEEKNAEKDEKQPSVGGVEA
ncbi:DEK domain-containing chromatin-associated protein 4-like [Solanum dulcamara]|uniref:DEK domain-containing chromatin-associated protein 4-like n=1 Tax=Solanum dulcamara TaxID=45834 RepID=UPI0024852F07|nr:DEK domain-containing chromatin-associated protein 4-like [Solanum dulcamara]XP_055807145.1 DEK domain-containing chromatin-associated protein 4-like [Solanum dulcamara]XP_055807146.1 DEK domain-containing chromatin-associated protein 4-like [Solanum dulcamara]XP_055807147.1 DEK domain-containing chromatin-associated protein 4-like [Solanum dulcamara]XP_055807148.1 DEK domain-containing chromatin-associated protein 4-like [Solanum dulcamara]XP_055807149.1 DEK domain-containing chromatin-ass